jgi:hypothetical protein
VIFAHAQFYNEKIYRTCGILKQKNQQLKMTDFSSLHKLAEHFENDCAEYYVVKKVRGLSLVSKPNFMCLGSFGSWE